MATAPKQRAARAVEYPTGDGKPMAETDLHRQDMVDLIETLQHRFADNPKVYVSGNILLFYEEGNRRKHVSPDVLVSFNVAKEPPRNYYLIWEEGKAPDVVIEITSKSTRREDKKTKKELYRNVLEVAEYFQFDPTEDYLKPSLQGFRRIDGEYRPIEPVNGRIPSQALGLHLERDGKELRLFDPATGHRLLKAAEREEAAARQARAARTAEVEQRQRAEAAESEKQRFAQDNDRLRQELEVLRRRSDSSA